MRRLPLPKESVYRYRVQANDDLTQGAKILRLFLDSSIAGETPFSDVRTRAEELLSTDRLARLCQHLVDDAGIDEADFEWQAVDQLMSKVKRNIRPILRSITLEGTAQNDLLLKTVKAITEAFQRGLTIAIGAVASDSHPSKIRPLPGKQ